MPKITPPNPGQNPLDISGKMTPVFIAWTQQITDLDFLVGAGSPEGVIAATQYKLYLDSTGTTGSIQWRKMLPNIAGNVKMGWVLL